jgi:hypothetical protein
MPTPIAPVWIAAPPVKVLVAAPTTELAMVVEGVGCPEVKGTSLAEEAPGNAADVVLGLGAAEVSFGLRTLKIVSITRQATTAKTHTHR